MANPTVDVPPLFPPPGDPPTEFLRNRRGNDSGYSVDQHSYPDDLLDNTGRYGGNYVVFYINVHEDSFLAKGERSVSIRDDFVQTRSRGNVSGLSELGIGAAAAAAITATSEAGGIPGKVTNLLSGGSVSLDRSTIAGRAVSGVGSLALGVGGITFASNQLGGIKKEYKRLKQAIALNVPIDLSARYSAQWQEESFTSAQAIAGGVSNFGEEDGLTSTARGYLAGLVLQAPGPGRLVSKASGLAANPKKEQLFQQVDFRTFTFAYQFFPRSEREAENVRQIIRSFKLHMHPEFKTGTSNFLYTYPSEFDIFYYQGAKENLNIHRHTSCVLTDMSVSYTPSSTFSTFKDGMPVQINMSLSFKELALLTKEDIINGF